MTEASNLLQRDFECGFPNSSAGRDFIIFMKTYKHLYRKIYSWENLKLAFRKARKGKGSKWYVKEFEKDLKNNLIALKAELEAMTYEPRKLKRFVIHDPRSRVIYASDFRDRVVHHALCNLLEPLFDKTFIFDSYANRKNKGTVAAILRFDKFKRKVSQNGRLIGKAKDNNMVVGYALKADIRHYFDTVDHEILMKIISRKIKDEKVLWLIRKIIDKHETKKQGKGMPIGNLTSQFFANVYLNEMDYFVKHRLRAKHYIRYVDDFVILGKKEALEEWKSQINEFLKTIKLELHPEKSKVMPLHHGINLLGFRVFYHYKLPYRRNIRRFSEKIEWLLTLYQEGAVQKKDIAESMQGWFAYTMWGSTYKMRQSLFGCLSPFLLFDSPQEIKKSWGIA